MVLADGPCDVVGAGPDLAVAFGETPGRFVCEVRPADAEAFAQQMAGVAWGWIGEVMGEPAIAIRATDGAVERIPVERLARSWRGEAN